MNFLPQGITSGQASFEPAELDLLASCGDDIRAKIYGMEFDGSEENLEIWHSKSNSSNYLEFEKPTI